MNWFEFSFSTFLWVFIALNLVNVVLQTIKNIATIKCGKYAAAAINAIAFALYTIVVVYMNAEGLGLVWKAVIIGLANFVGVYAVKLFEEKSRKDKLWKVEATVPSSLACGCVQALAEKHIPHNYVAVKGYVIINCYCHTQADSLAVKAILAEYNAKYFVSESKAL